MKLEQMTTDETQGFYYLTEKQFLIMILKRLERIENKIDQKTEDAIRERLDLRSGNE